MAHINDVCIDEIAHIEKWMVLEWLESFERIFGWSCNFFGMLQMYVNMSFIAAVYGFPSSYLALYFRNMFKTQL